MLSWSCVEIVVRPDIVPVVSDSGERTPDRACDFSVGSPVCSHLLNLFILFCVELWYF